MTEKIVLLSFAASATIHFVLCIVTAVFAHYRVKYLALAWILGICAAVLCVVGYFSESVASGHPGELHPAMMWMLLTGTFLQSIYTFGFSMPGFLQWERMLQYAMPIVLIGVVYALFPGARWVGVLSLIVAVGYIANIYLLPRRMAKKTPIPHYLMGYTFFMTLSYALYIYVAVRYSPILLCVFILLFSLLNCFLVFITLDGLAQHLPQPEVGDETDTTDTGQGKPEPTDFNERNVENYRVVEHWMATHKHVWVDSTFNRDKLCIEVGLNRQLLLQCLRSQGHNNVHEYLTRYRVKELKRLIERGEVTQLNECVDAGFGVVKTAKMSFQRIEGIALDDFLKEHAKGGRALKVVLVALLLLMGGGMTALYAQTQALTQQTAVKGDVSQRRKMSQSAFPVQITKMGTALKIQSDHNQILPIYTHSGAFYMVMRLTKGTNFLSGLPRGRYFINNRIVSIGIDTEQ